jgi:hypothetical protein
MNGRRKASGVVRRALNQIGFKKAAYPVLQVTESESEDQPVLIDHTHRAGKISGPSGGGNLLRSCANCFNRADSNRHEISGMKLTPRSLLGEGQKRCHAIDFLPASSAWS